MLPPKKPIRPRQRSEKDQRSYHDRFRSHEDGKIEQHDSEADGSRTGRYNLQIPGRPYPYDGLQTTDRESYLRPGDTARGGFIGEDPNIPFIVGRNLGSHPAPRPSRPMGGHNGPTFRQRAKARRMGEGWYVDGFDVLRTRNNPVESEAIPTQWDYADAYAVFASGLRAIEDYVYWIEMELLPAVNIDEDFYVGLSEIHDGGDAMFAYWCIKRYKTSEPTTGAGPVWSDDNRVHNWRIIGEVLKYVGEPITLPTGPSGPGNVDGGPGLWGPIPWDLNFVNEGSQKGCWVYWSKSLAAAAGPTRSQWLGHLADGQAWITKFGDPPCDWWDYTPIQKYFW